MAVANDIVIILALTCFIVGTIMGVHLMRPHYYGVHHEQRRLYQYDE